MTKLLVSVYFENDLDTVLKAKIDIIDFKNPYKGSLGLPEYKHIISLLNKFDISNYEKSIVLGEFQEDYKEYFKYIQKYLNLDFQFYKIGLKSKNLEEFKKLIQLVKKNCNGKVIAVLPSDYKLLNLPDIEVMLNSVVSCEIDGVLIDTFIKNNYSTLDHINLDKLRNIVKFVKDQGLIIGIAGKLDFNHVELILKNKIKPDVIGVRSCVCKLDRSSEIDFSKVIQLKNLIKNLS